MRYGTMVAKSAPLVGTQLTTSDAGIEKEMG
jgi:hypothetical protein